MTISMYYFFALFFFLGGTGVLTQGFVLTKLVLYCLSHDFSPFCSGYSEGGGSKILSRPTLNFDPLDLNLTSS
jgi:hypothetical protein